MCRELADRKGWPVGEVYVDNDRSAYTGKRRPAFEQMLADVEAGLRDALIAVDQDRLTRHVRELEDLVDFADRHALPLANVSGDLDLSTSDGRFRARIMGVVARQESEKKSERISREREHRARRGVSHPRGRVFGYELNRSGIRQEEAEAIQDAARRVLAGESRAGIVRDLTAAGMTTVSGHDFTVTRLNTVLRRPDIAGLRVHQEEVVGEGQWQAILDRATWERVQVVLDRTRRKGRPRKHLLTGLLVCGKCGTQMTSSVKAGNRTYACRKITGQFDDACAGVSIKAEWVEGFVTEMIVHRLSGPALAGAQAGVTDEEARRLTEQMRADEAALGDLARDLYVDRIIDRRQFIAARGVLDERIEETRGRLAQRRTRPTVELPSDPEELRVWWDQLDLETRRLRTAELVERVVIGPMPPKDPKVFHAERIEDVVWRV